MRSLDIPGPGWQRLLARLMLGINKPRQDILGMELAGTIEAAGKGVTRFKPGDQVFASTLWSGFGAYAEYKSMSEDGVLASKPNNITFDEAAVIPSGGITTLGIIKMADLKPGQKVLIYGASGSVGTFAVQLARAFETQVTGVCSTPNLDLVKSLGADQVIDYTREDFSQSGETYDVIFDAVDKYPTDKAKKALNPGGTYLNVDSSSDKIKQNEVRSLLEQLKELIEAEKLKAVIDRTYPLDQIVAAHRYVDQGHKKGNVVITVAPLEKASHEPGVYDKR
jgi:NADPH:quinone reductase-like Zn-dependent oxidoreductase